MISVVADFRERKQEVNDYFAFVKALSVGEINIQDPTGRFSVLKAGRFEELIKTAKASCYLLLYNLVESTMRNLLQAIFDEFRQRGVKFDDCRTEVKRLVLCNLQKRNPDNVMEKLMDLARDIVSETYEKSEFFSGNLDARQIRETAKCYGFNPLPEKFGWAMRSVKDKRNDLAHGLKSFTEVGKDTTQENLEQARRQSTVALFLTIKSVKAYLTERLYLTQAPLA